MKKMSPDMKLIILANCNEKLFCWTFTFCKVMRQQNWRNVLVSIQASSMILSEPNNGKNMKIGPLVSNLAKKNSSGLHFSETRGTYACINIGAILMSCSTWTREFWPNI